MTMGRFDILTGLERAGVYHILETVLELLRLQDILVIFTGRMDEQILRFKKNSFPDFFSSVCFRSFYFLSFKSLQVQYFVGFYD